VRTQKKFGVAFGGPKRNLAEVRIFGGGRRYCVVVGMLDFRRLGASLSAGRRGNFMRGDVCVVDDDDDGANIVSMSSIARR